MLLSLSTTHQPASDLGFLLRKHPERLFQLDISVGTAYVFYPEVQNDRCTAVLLLDIDPIGLVRGKEQEQFALKPYVNDRPYVASSFLSVALNRVFRSAMNGDAPEKPALAQMALPLEVQIPVLACRGGLPLLQRLLGPLGYTVTASPISGSDMYYSVSLSVKIQLSLLLNHLYVLLPVLDDEKHYWVGTDEIDKLLRSGEGWLETHPEKELIAHRYLSHQRRLTRLALSRLLGEEDTSDPDAIQQGQEAQEEAVEAPMRLDDIRRQVVLEQLKAAGAQRVVDWGCGEGKLLKALLQDRYFSEIIGVEVSLSTLHKAVRRLGLDQLPERQKSRIKLLHGSVTARDKRVQGYDAFACIEVIEHLELNRLESFAEALFGAAAPKTVILTTPNIEYNAVFQEIAPKRYRHPDHRFEWSRAEFQQWAQSIIEKYAYHVSFLDIGEAHPLYGPPTQAALFSRVS